MQSSPYRDVQLTAVQSPCMRMQGDFYVYEEDEKEMVDSVTGKMRGCVAALPCGKFLTDKITFA